MKQLRIYLCCFLVVLLFLSLTACATPVTDPTTAPTTTAIVPTTTATEPQPTTEPVGTPKKLTIMVCNNAHAGELFLDFNKREDSNVWIALEKMLDARGLEIEWIVVAEEDYEDALAAVLNGTAEVMPDAVWLGDAPVTQKVAAVASGMLTPLEEILPYSDGSFAKFLEAFPEYRAANAYDGKLWWFGEYTFPTYDGKALSPEEGSLYGLTVRLDWLDRFYGTLGMGIPQTVEELEAYLQACQTEDINQDPDKGEYLVSTFQDITNAGLNNIYGVPNHHFAVNLQTGTVDSPWTSPETKEMLKTLLRWLEEGYIDKACIGADSTYTWRQTNQCATRAQMLVYNTYDSTEVPPGADRAQQIGVIPDTSVHPNAYIARMPNSTGKHADMAFTSALSSKRAAAELLDLLLSEEFESLMEWGTEGDNYVIINGKKQFIEGGKLNCSIINGAERPVTNGEYYLSTGILPWIRQSYDLMSDEYLCCSDYTGRVLKEYQKAQTTPSIYFTTSRDFLAVPTPSESAVIAQYEEGFTALSQQIFQAILRGEIDIDTQWESHVLTPLREAGMEELLSVYQTRADRYFQ